MKVSWEGRFALSSNGLTFKPDTIIINHQLEFHGTRVKYLDHEKRAYKHEIWSYRISLFVCFVALRPKSTAMVIAGQSVHLTTLFPGQT